MKDELKLELLKNRRALHAAPELSMQEQATAAFIKNKLIEYGIEVEEGVNGTYGLLGCIRVNDGSAVAYRADMDALAVEEGLNLPYKSQTPGVMHACGHDGHMAMALALAKYFSQNKDKLKKNLIFLFQPAEEKEGGAEKMIASDFISRYKIESIFGAHVSPELEEGMIGCAAGTIMSRIGVFSIEIKGVSSHSATPHQGRDALMAACQLVINLQAALGKLVDPLSGTTLNIGRIEAGTTDNLVASSAVIMGNLRSLDMESFEHFKKSIYSIARHTAEIFGCSATVSLTGEFPEVNNDKMLFDKLRNSVRGKFVELKPQLISEDFSFYQQQIPGLFFFVGIRNEKENYRYPLHSDKFGFREEALETGVEAFIDLMHSMEVLSFPAQ